MQTKYPALASTFVDLKHTNRSAPVYQAWTTLDWTVVSRMIKHTAIINYD